MNQSQAPSLDWAWNWLVSQVPEELRPALGIFAALAILVWIFVKALKTLLDLAAALAEMRRRRAREREEKAPHGPLPAPRVSVWTPPVNNPPRPFAPSDGGIPIITTANMKGGVGKTTLTANLAAYFDSMGKRVLLIDLDYQGSLSQTALAAANIARIGSVVDDLIRGDHSAAQILQASQTLDPALPNSRILTCYYEFSDTETHEMVDWLVAVRNGTPTDDLRFRLTKLLRDDAIQNNFDIVLIDAPPRFSTGTINALCASTHLVIPTVLDQMSAEAVIYFSRDVAAMKKNLFPQLRLIGVVPTLVYQSTAFSQREQDVIRRINEALRPYWGVKQAVLEKAFVPRKNAIGDIAGAGIGFFDAGQQRYTKEVRDIFVRVGRQVEDRLGP